MEMEPVGLPLLQAWIQSDMNVEVDVSGFDEINSDLLVNGDGIGGGAVRHCREQR